MSLKVLQEALQQQRYPQTLDLLFQWLNQFERNADFDYQPDPVRHDPTLLAHYDQLVIIITVGP